MRNRAQLTAAMVFCVFAGYGLPAAAQAPYSHQHSFSGAEKWAKSFDDPARDAWQKPHEVISALALASDSVVADIGSGTGYFAVRLAHAVPRGRVLAVDTEPDMVAYLARRAKQAGLANLVSITVRPDALVLPEKVDLALLVDVYHHIGDRVSYFAKLRDSLKPGSRVAVIDFNTRSPIGPPVRERIAVDKVKAEMRDAGYRLLAEPGFLPNQYFLIFESAAG